MRGADSVWECMRLENDENVSPLVRPVSEVGSKVYAVLRLFIANKIDRFRLQSALLELGVSEQGVFSNEFQHLLTRQSENAMVLFAQLRSSLMRHMAACVQPSVPTSIPVLTEIRHCAKVDVATMTARTTQTKSASPRAPHYEPLPLLTARNPMYAAQERKVLQAQQIAAKKLSKILTHRPVSAAMLGVVSKSFVDKTLLEGALLSRP